MHNRYPYENQNILFHLEHDTSGKDIKASADLLYEEAIKRTNTGENFQYDLMEEIGKIIRDQLHELVKGEKVDSEKLDLYVSRMTQFQIVYQDNDKKYKTVANAVLDAFREIKDNNYQIPGKDDQFTAKKDAPPQQNPATAASTRANRFLKSIKSSYEMLKSKSYTPTFIKSKREQREVKNESSNQDNPKKTR